MRYPKNNEFDIFERKVSKVKPREKKDPITTKNQYLTKDPTMGSKYLTKILTNPNMP
jgi:hypothetical protein